MKINLNSKIKFHINHNGAKMFVYLLFDGWKMLETSYGSENIVYAELELNKNKEEMGSKDGSKRSPDFTEYAEIFTFRYTDGDIIHLLIEPNGNTHMPNHFKSFEEY
ncbi:hypothetical protein Anas_05279 [Armadillidium nasatum]|uniref:Uncharacterized protein n=1 Tax=Armadillidium nasatum TaxID=96803 RepID=A0A5N5T7W3_9CRUS|nr:hypothetical protein Anas_05279 [Armadillidium nasatum]